MADAPLENPNQSPEQKRRMHLGIAVFAGFRDKMRALFVRRAKAVFPQEAG